MGPWSKRNGANGSFNANNRLNLMLAFIFLAVGALVLRLFNLQVNRHGYFLSAAANQHEVYTQLEPARGKIFLQEKSGELYPLASNKDFVVIYAVPAQLAEARAVAEKLYDFFKKEAVEKEVGELLKLQEEERLQRELEWVKSLPEAEQTAKVNEVRQAHQIFLSGGDYLAAKEARRQEMIAERQRVILSEYQKILERTGDPYEPLEKKVELTAALNFHLALVGQTAALTAADLEIASGKVFSRKDNQELVYPGIGYGLESYRVYSEGGVAAHLLGFTSYERSERNGQVGKHGNYGLEGFFDEELFGRYGSVKSERGVGGVVIVQDREYREKTDGDDLVLTIDRSVQFFVDKALRDGIKKYGAASGSVLVLKPQTGEIMAMSSWPDFDPNKYNEVKESNIFNNPVIFEQYEPGSVFKAVTMAAALDQGAVTPSTVYNDTGQIMIEGWPKPIKNSDFDSFGAHGATTMMQVLEKSLNTGSIFAMKSSGPEIFVDYVKKFGFGEKSGLELEGESAGDISPLTGKKIKPISAATASFGQGISVTPLQMATAFAVIANGGRLVKPYLVKEVRHADGQVTASQPRTLRQVISAATASTLSGMLINVVENGHAKAARVRGYYVAGKTGTAQTAAADKKGYSDKYNHTFVGFAPADNVQFVVLVKLYNPTSYAYAEGTAVPLAHDIIKFLLNYWQIPKTR